MPEEQWAIEGKTISEWIITMVSLTNPQGGIIGQMEYHEAIKRLEPFILMKKDNWALIRAMTHEELDSLFGNLPRKLYCITYRFGNQARKLSISTLSELW